MKEITLERLLNELRNAGVVIRNMEIAIERLERSDLKLEDQVKALFAQGRSIGVHLYKDVHYNHSKLISKLNELEVTPSTTQIIVGNLRNDSPAEAAKYETF
ncbi:hypothetical protein [Vibrio cholerae]|uniref:hypothetical protein n=1 Tax=Vibrio cholerae TaxID=666 RepID=UPI000E68DB67|nr:hypothetical protein [Vibrio cholerae]